MWRWSSKSDNLDALHEVFSTYVEVILIIDSLPDFIICFLHVCGGDPARQIL